MLRGRTRSDGGDGSGDGSRFRRLVLAVGAALAVAYVAGRLRSDGGRPDRPRARTIDVEAGGPEDAAAGPGDAEGGAEADDAGPDG